MHVLPVQPFSVLSFSSVYYKKKSVGFCNIPTPDPFSRRHEIHSQSGLWIVRLYASVLYV